MAAIGVESGVEGRERVRAHIGDIVLEFCQENSVFYMSELFQHVRDKVGRIAPDSPSRILRLLKSLGKVDYEVLDRATSLYQVLRVER